MIFFIPWFAIGAFFAWRALLAISPVVTRGDLIVIVITGVFMPIAVLLWIQYGWRDWWNKPIHTLSRRK